jgi:hypothetical protein
VSCNGSHLALVTEMTMTRVRGLGRVLFVGTLVGSIAASPAPDTVMLTGKR